MECHLYGCRRSLYLHLQSSDMIHFVAHCIEVSDLLGTHCTGSFRGGLSDGEYTYLSHAICGVDALDIQIYIVSVIRTERNALQYGTNGGNQILPLNDLLKRSRVTGLFQYVHDFLQQLSQRIRCDAVLLRLCTERIDERSECSNIHDFEFLAKVRSRNEG